VVFQLIKFSLKLQDDFALSVISDFSAGTRLKNI